MVMEIDVEKKVILNYEGSVLVIANPGTGKTFLLGLKYVELLKKGVRPEDILCLTFTQEAKKNMEKQIIKFVEKEGFDFDFSSLNVFTFHSFAMSYLDDNNIIGSNLLRYAIFKFLKEKDVFNYPDDYLVSTIVPRFENLIRYLKSFGITFDKINKEKTIEVLDDFVRSKDVINKEELVVLLDYFVNIFEEYESLKKGRGVDYADLLIEFIALEKKPFFKHVLVDELQDVNELEARIAIMSGEVLFAVGDPKQSIFGFQGGSTKNFGLFVEAGAKKFELNENRRSTQQILDFAALDYYEKSVEENKEDVLRLVSADKKSGNVPELIEASKDQVVGKISVLLEELEGQTAIITRTNGQILELAKELESKSMDFSTTYFSSSIEAKNSIIVFLKAVFSNNVNDVRKAFFTPFFPILMSDAFELSKNKELTLEQVFEKSPEFKNIRSEQKNFESVKQLFLSRIFPVSVAHGEDYLLAAKTLLEASVEALNIFDGISLEDFIFYLQTTDLLASSVKKDSKIILTTVHKSKGIEFDNVIYVPKSLGSKTNFLDYVVESILKAKDINVKEELEEEKLRIDFVAYTRAKNKLFLVSDKPKDFLNKKIVLREIEGEQVALSFAQKQVQAYNLFVNKEYDKAKKLLETDSSWLKKMVENHFVSLDHVSFSRLNKKAFDYLQESILNIQQSSTALSIGSEVHDLLKNFLNGEKIVVSDEEKKYFDNAVQLIEQIKKIYPELVRVEDEIKIPLSLLVNTSEKLDYFGIIDAIFRNGDEYLLVDWKTSKDTSDASVYRRQLELYKRAFSIKHQVPLKKIKTFIAFIGLKKTINDGDILSELDERQPQARVFGTLEKHFNNFLRWKTNPQNFFEDLSREKQNNALYDAVMEQYNKEK